MFFYMKGFPFSFPLQVTASYFIRGCTFALIQHSYLLKITESDLLEVTSYLIPNTRITIFTVSLERNE